MTSWAPSEDEELSVHIYEAVRTGMWTVHGMTPEGEALYELTELGRARARARAIECGLDPATLTEERLIAIEGDLVR